MQWNLLLPVDIRCDNLTESIYEPHKNYVRCWTGNKALWHVQECPWVTHSYPVLYTRICSAREEIRIFSTVYLHFLPPFMGLKTYFLQKQSSTPLSRHERKLQEVPYATHTSLILPLDAASCLVTMAGTKGSGEGCFLERGECIVPRFLERCSRDRWEPAGTSEHKEQTSVENVQGPEISRRGWPRVWSQRARETEGEMLYCSLLSSSSSSPLLCSIPHY